MEFHPPARSIADILERLAHRDRASALPGHDQMHQDRRQFRESVVSTTERIARSIALRDGMGPGPVPFHMRTDARSQRVWKRACSAMRIILDVDVDDMVMRLRIDDAARRHDAMREIGGIVADGLGDV